MYVVTISGTKEFANEEDAKALARAIRELADEQNINISITITYNA